MVLLYTKSKKMKDSFPYKICISKEITVLFIHETCKNRELNPHHHHSKRTQSRSRYSRTSASTSTNSLKVKLGHSCAMTNKKQGLENCQKS
jgi:hypothetical protein